MNQNLLVSNTVITVVGTGLVGLGWVIVFARAGLVVRLHDSDIARLNGALVWVKRSLIDLSEHNLISESPDQILARCSCHADLKEALNGAGYVQESVPERVDVKRDLYGAMDGLLASHTLVGSSSSGIPASAFTEDIAFRERCLIAHPVNPPYLAPIVELVPSSWTTSEVVETVHELMQHVGQHPIRVSREIEGFVLNRLQGVLLREAWALYDEGYCSLGDIDATISKGLGLRWSFMGPFETIDLNAPGGIRDYADRLGGLYLSIARERTNQKVWDDDLITRVEKERRQSLPFSGLKARSNWRDRRMMALAAHKQREENSE
jgi:3-hydroxyacyl-CoA dehydrogenase